MNQPNRYTASGQPPHCYCCNERFRPRKHRALCDACYQAVDRFSRMTPKQVERTVRSLRVSLARVRLATEWPTQDATEPAERDTRP